MSEMPEFEQRLGALEQVVGPLDRDAADIKALLRSHTGLLQALRESQNGMQRVLNDQGLALGEMVLHWTRSSERLSDLDRRVGAVEVGLSDVNRRLAGVDNRLAALQEGQAALQAGQAALQAGQAALQEGQAEILRRLPGA